MKRHEIREATFLALFMHDFYRDIDERTLQMRLFLESFHPDIYEDDEEELAGEISDRQKEDDSLWDGIEDDIIEEIYDRLYQVCQRIEEIDARIDDASASWSISRMNRVDLSVLRLCVYELFYDELDTGIAINEAVELAKQYGTDDSGRFVNGILGEIVRNEKDG